MVLFDNINVGQRVEVLRGGYVFQATVKFKGFLNGVPGEWVGVELNKKAGKHDGMIGGRRYFKCMAGHGIFTTASKIRFIPMKRCLYNSYRPISPEDSFVEDSLFESTGPREVQSPRESRVSKSYRDKTQNAEFPDMDVYGTPYFPLRHSVGNYIPAATMLNQDLQRAKCYSYTSRPFYGVDYDLDPSEFISSPTIPQPHMPHSALRRQVGRGWEKDKYVRSMSVNTGREAMHYSTWNHL